MLRRRQPTLTIAELHGFVPHCPFAQFVFTTMHALLPSLIAACLYVAATVYQVTCLLRRHTPNKRTLFIVGGIAVALHAFSLAVQVPTEQGLNLDFFNAASLVSCSIILVALLAAIRLPLENIFLLLFPLAAVSALCAGLIPAGTSHPVDNWGILSHVVLSILSYGMFTLAVLQALLLFVQDRQLKHKRPNNVIVSNFPPLETMEALLFGFLWAGWLLLSLSLLSGFIFLNDMFAQHLVHKTILSCFAWLVFAVLLGGRHFLGWRGHIALRWTFAGFCLLMLAYFGSKLVREFILHI